jgi:hypothetical protein
MIACSQKALFVRSLMYTEPIAFMPGCFLYHCDCLVHAISMLIISPLTVADLLAFLTRLQMINVSLG